MRCHKSTAAVLVAIAAWGFSGCNGPDRGHEKERVVEHTTVVENTVVPPPVDEHRVDEQRDPHRDDRPCDHARDPHCDDKPR
jgi:hypothetical protein